MCVLCIHEMEWTQHVHTSIRQRQCAYMRVCAFEYPLSIPKKAGICTAKIANIHCQQEQHEKEQNKQNSHQAHAENSVNIIIEYSTHTNGNTIRHRNENLP